MRGNQQIVRADRPAPPGERVADLAVVCARVRIERQDVEIEAESFELARVALDAFRVGDPVAKLGIRTGVSGLIERKTNSSWKTKAMGQGLPSHDRIEAVPRDQRQELQ